MRFDRLLVDLRQLRSSIYIGKISKSTSILSKSTVREYTKLCRLQTMSIRKSVGISSNGKCFKWVNWHFFRTIGIWMNSLFTLSAVDCHSSCTYFFPLKYEWYTNSIRQMNNIIQNIIIMSLGYSSWPFWMPSYSTSTLDNNREKKFFFTSIISERWTFGRHLVLE